MAVISRGIKLSYASDGDYTELTNLQEIPDLGGDTESIEITTLADGAHKYTDGIKNYGETLPFKFLYTTEGFAAAVDLTGELKWKVEFPDAATCAFNGTCSVKLDGVGVNSALTYTLSIRPTTEMVWG